MSSKTVAQIAAETGFEPHQVRHVIERLSDELNPVKIGNTNVYAASDCKLIVARLLSTSRRKA